MKRRKEGFTLVELLIVMAVIAALMGALVPVAMSAIKHANATRVAENMRSLLTAAQQYTYSEHEIPSISKIKAKHLVTGSLNTTDYEIAYAASSTGGLLTPISSNTKWPTGNPTAVTIGVAYKSGISADDIHKVWVDATSTNALSGYDVVATTTIAAYW